MDSIPISKFKATCTAVVERVETTRARVIITKRGRPVAEVVPHTPSAGAGRRLGYMAGTARILEDLVGFSDDDLRTVGEGTSPRVRRKSAKSPP